MSHPHADQSLAEAAGVPASTVTALREERLTPGTHWRKEGGGVIAYTPEGLDVMRPLLEALTGEAMRAPEKEGGPPVVERCRILIREPNPTWVRVQTSAGPQHVRVRDHRRIKGATALLECARDADGIWRCVAPSQTPARS